jgi:hypothetical protein
MVSYVEKAQYLILFVETKSATYVQCLLQVRFIIIHREEIGFMSGINNFHKEGICAQARALAG